MRLLLILISVFVVVNLSASAQTTIPKSIKIEKCNDTQKFKYYEKSIYAANMESFRLKSKDVVLPFSEGFECVLYSAQSLKDKNGNVNLDNYKEEFPANYFLPTFSIAPNGTIMAGYKKQIEK